MPLPYYNREAARNIFYGYVLTCQECKAHIPVYFEDDPAIQHHFCKECAGKRGLPVANDPPL